jgi:hypothetical protein
MKNLLFRLWLVCGLLVSCLLPLGVVRAENTNNFYTKPKPDAAGGITGKVDRTLFIAIALERDRTSSYKAVLEDGGTRFVFKGLPTGKYDLLLVTKDDHLVEGLFLGEPGTSVTGESYNRFEERIRAADGFFNKFQIQRFGLIQDGAKILALIERMRDKETLTQGGEKLAGAVRRLEIAQFDRSADTWAFLVNRHLYREQEAPGKTQFLTSHHVPQLSGIRVIESVKDVGMVALPK